MKTMDKRIFLLLFLAMAAAGGRSQTLAQARALYDKGEYGEAKAAFRRLAQSQPANGNYSLWYGVCCLKTGDAAAAVPPLEAAVRRRVPGGQLYLGQAYHAAYRFDDAVEVYESYIAELKRRKRPSDEAEALLEKSRTGARLMRGVEETCVIDSVVADKDDFLSAYKISPEAGKLFMYDAYFKTGRKTAGIVYETELGTDLYYARPQADSTLTIVASRREEGGWSPGAPLPGVAGEGENAGYPYMMTDGVTLYYAADGAGSLGGYDIFVTRYNTGSGAYLAPENIGMPFNSPCNDYMYVIDEYANLGWFASDRRQPEGKVCIYVFVPNASRKAYDFEGVPEDRLRRLASLQSIGETAPASGAPEEARRRLEELREGKAEAPREYEFSFVVNDKTVYHSLGDFRSAQAKESFTKYRSCQEDLRQAERKLEALRAEYLHAGPQRQNDISPSILGLEERARRLGGELERLAALARAQEAGLKDNP